MDSLVYYGETTCQAKKANGVSCTNNAYFVVGDAYLCGVHSKSKPRQKLLVNPNKKAIKEESIAQHHQSCLLTKQQNAEHNLPGQVICGKMSMMKEVQHIAGFLSVFPNKNHGNRTDGLGIPALSPMNLGPVVHGQSGLPPAVNLENFWQASKLYPQQVLCKETDHSLCSESCFRKYQLEMFRNGRAERHNKFAKDAGGKKVVPLGWVWTKANGETSLFSYVQSRQFYCTFYERLTRASPEYDKLVELVRDGTSVQILGYDGRKIETGQNKDGMKRLLEAYYLDGSAPFGHELVLVSMLVLEKDEMPWVRHKTEEF